MAKTRNPFGQPSRNPLAFKVIRNAETASEAELIIYGQIAPWEVDARTVVREIRALDAETIHVRINSPGGNVFDGVSIFNALKEHPAKIVTHVDAVAASIASLIALAGDEVRIAENAFFMIHNAAGLVFGSAEDLRKTADLFDKVEESTLVKAYLARTGENEATIRSWMKEETWFDAQEAIDAGFADVVDERSPVQAVGDLSIFAKAPAALVAAARAGVAAEPPKTLREFESVLREKCGFSHAAARAIAAGGFKPQTDPRDEDDQGVSFEPLASVASEIRSLIVQR